MCKIFADDTSSFSRVNDKNNSNFQLNSDLAKIRKWAFQRKVPFNPDPNKQATEAEVCFSNKRDKGNYPLLHFNSTDFQLADSQKHLGLILDSNLNFNEHVDSKITKCNEIISLIKKLPQTFSRTSSTQKQKQAFRTKTKAFELSLFSHCTKEWGNLSVELRNIH